MKKSTVVIISLAVLVVAVVAGSKAVKKSEMTTHHAQTAGADVISFPCAVILFPDSLKIEKLKAEGSEEDFYTAADDWQYYIFTASHYLDSVKARIVRRSSTGKVKFRAIDGTTFSFDADSVSWGMLLFNGRTKPVDADITDIDVDYRRYMK